MTNPYPPRRKQSCGNCRYWIKDSSPEWYGYCHRHAPQAAIAGARQFPHVAGNNWCGEWAPLEAQA